MDTRRITEFDPKRNCIEDLFLLANGSTVSDLLVDGIRHDAFVSDFLVVLIEEHVLG